MNYLLTLMAALAIAEAPIQVTDSLDKTEVFILKENFQEAIGSLKDVPSSDRNNRYRDLLERAAVGFVRSESKDLSNAERIADGLPKTFPLLAKSESFQFERDRVSQLGFTACFDASKENEECALRLYSRVEKDPLRTSYLLWAAMQLYTRGKLELSYKAFALGAKSKGTKQVCESPTLIEVSIHTLAKGAPYDPNYLKVLKEECWKGARGKLAKEIANQKDEGFLKNACALFKEMKTRHAKCPTDPN